MADVIALFVLDARNDYQDALVRSARFCCERRGLQLEVHDAGNSSDKQLQQIIACVRGPARARTAALLVHPVLDGMHEQAAQEAARVGLGWVLLNRVGAYVTDLRQRYPQVPLFAVTPDQVEIGRMQGRAVRALLPSGGRVLYVQGPLMASSSRARASGMEEVLKDAGVAVQSLRGDWSARSGEQTVSLWLLRALPAGEVSDLVVAQNDAMASGARSALAAAAREHGRPELAELPIVGCDGVTAFGARLVKEGVLTATVVVPGTAAPAVDEIVRMRQGGPPPPAELRLPVTLQPDPSALRPLTNRRTTKSPGG
jgi:ABC-type sugar transport system substrate-binding protein